MGLMSPLTILLWRALIVNGSTVNGRLPVNMAYMLTPLNRNKAEIIIEHESSNLAHDEMVIDCNVCYMVNPTCGAGSDSAWCRQLKKWGPKQLFLLEKGDHWPASDESQFAYMAHHPYLYQTNLKPVHGFALISRVKSPNISEGLDLHPPPTPPHPTPPHVAMPFGFHNRSLNTADWNVKKIQLFHFALRRVQIVYVAGLMNSHAPNVHLRTVSVIVEQFRCGIRRTSALCNA